MTSGKVTREQLRTSEINGAILVARKLVRLTLAGKDKGMIFSITDRARYCQLMSAKMKLSALEASRTVLAAWLSGLDHDREMIGAMVMAHGVSHILHPEPGCEGNARLEADILSLVICYQELKEGDERVGRDMRMTRKLLGKAWVRSDENRLRMAKRFVNILENEIFLDKCEMGAGNVLIVDPQESVSPVLAVPLTHDGYNVRVVSDVEGANELMAGIRPDLIICAMEMHFCGGLEFCARLKKDPATSDIPFIMLASRKGKKVETDSLRAGADDCISRPVDFELLILKMKKLCRVSRREEGRKAFEGVAGTLGEMDFTDMIQILCAGGKTSEIMLESAGREGCVCVQDGEIVDARAGRKTGEEAFYELMTWREGSFKVLHSEGFSKRTIDSTTMSLLMEGARIADESAGVEVS